MNCVFKITPLHNGKFLYKCKRPTCPNEMTLDKNDPKMRRECKGLQQSKRVFNFTVAAIKHVLRCAPTCTQEEIDARLAVCHKCPLFVKHKTNPDIGYCSHKDCGCPLNPKGFLSKLAWADQICPIKRWLRLR